MFGCSIKNAEETRCAPFDFKNPLSKSKARAVFVSVFSGFFHLGVALNTKVSGAMDCSGGGLSMTGNLLLPSGWEVVGHSDC